MASSTRLSKRGQTASARRKSPPPRPKRLAGISISPTPPSPDRILQIAWGYAAPLILETALNYRIFDLLEEDPQTAEQLTERTGTSIRGMTAILNALVGLKFLERQGVRYALTLESSNFLVSSRPTYYGTYFTHMARQLIPRWLRLVEAVRTGRPVAATNQADQGPTFFAEFVESLFPLSYKAASILAEHLGIPHVTAPITVLDIGAGSGVWGIALAHQSPHVSIVAVDWPIVLQVTRKVARRQGVVERLKTIPGDLLEVDFGNNHQVATIGHILHSEGRERSRQLLRKIFNALAPG